MKKLIFVWACLFLTINAFSFTPGQSDNNLISCLKIKPYLSTANDISNLLGQPVKVEQNKKKKVWFYNIANGNLVIYWNSRNENIEKIFYSTLQNAQKKKWDYDNARLLKLGETKMTDVIKHLGIPKEMLIKENNQHIRYAYQYTMLNLFFRKGTLVNYTLF